MNLRERENLENTAGNNIDIVTRLAKEHEVSEETAAICLLAAQIRGKENDK